MQQNNVIVAVKADTKQGDLCAAGTQHRKVETLLGSFLSDYVLLPVNDLW